MNKIKQLIPATGWYLRFQKSGGGFAYQKLIFWAVFEEASENDFVTGLIAGPDGKLTPCSTLDNIDGYSFEPKIN